MTVAGTRHGPSTATSLRVLYTLFVRLQSSRWRLLGLGALGVVGVLLAVVTRRADDPTEAGTALVSELGLGLIAPVCTLWVATAMFSDLTEDRLLAYLWLRPVPRWHLAVAAVGATLTLVLPIVVVPLTVAGVVADAPGLPAAALGAGTLAVCGYAGLFVWAGARSTRALWWGLLYILVWEDGLARLATGTARLAVRSYPESLLARATDVSLRLDGRSPLTIVAVPLALLLVGTLLTARRLDRHDVD